MKSFPKDWELPPYSILKDEGRRSKLVLLIPIVDESPRIQKQLIEIRELELQLDVIVVDGGSLDDAPQSICGVAYGVTTILIKKGSGELGAQLRLGFAWSLMAGYEGVITMDGNGKDGVGALDVFVQKLSEGFVYVQGSRFAKGGLHENTPIDRLIANRYVHAPLVCFGGRYRFTDTTNGFRGYSASFLMHPIVTPFRECFSGYELLFFLTRQASCYFEKVCEVGVTRIYPPRSSALKIPTKINTLSKKLSVLMQTLKVVIGVFNVKDLRDKS